MGPGSTSARQHPRVRDRDRRISAFVDARGVITQRTGLFVPAVLVADVPRLVERGLYARWGDWFAQICVVLSVGLLALAAWRRQRDREPRRR